MKEDSQLLKEYLEEDSGDAFAAIVERHLDLVYSVAYRQVGGNEAFARDVCQEAFIALAREARTLSKDVVLSGWLYRSARFIALDAMRSESRRRKREQEAYLMNEDSGEYSEVNWDDARPILDEAISGLRESDRAAVCLRFYEKRSFSEIGSRLGISENTARMRVNRALEKLSRFLTSRGIRSTSMAVTAAIAGQSAIAAPIGLAASIANAAPAGVAMASGGSAWGVMIAFMNTTKFALGGSALLTLFAVGTALYQLQELDAANLELSGLRTQASDGAALDSRLSELAARIAEREAELGSLNAQRETTNETGPHGFTALEMEDAMERWVSRAAKVVEFASSNEIYRIPELELLETSDWLKVVGGQYGNQLRLETEADYRLMMARARAIAKGKTIQPLRKAFNAYLQQSEGSLPQYAHEIYEYAEETFDPAILDRYELGKLGDFEQHTRFSDRLVLYETNPVDPIWGGQSYVGPRTFGGSSWVPGGPPLLLNNHAWRPVTNAIGAFEEENGRQPDDSSELRPYLKEAMNEALYEEIFEAMSTRVRLPSSDTSIGDEI